MKQHIPCYFICIILFLLVSGCDRTAESAPPVSQTLQPLSITPSATQSRLTQSVREPTATPWHTPTIPATSTFTPMPTTLTPLPTLLPGEAQAMVIELLETNAGCRLPCWWGITPGQTTWEEALRFLERFALRISIYPSSNVIHVNVSIPLPREVPYAYELFQAYLIQDGIVEEIEVYNYDFANHTYLPEFLETYGQPEEVYIRTEHLGIRSVGPFALALFYPSQGILMETPGGGGSVDEDIIRNCLRDMNWPFLYLWSPERQMSFVEAEEKYMSGPDSGYFLPLLDATGMTVAEFYENFKDPNTTACLETPLDLWP